MTEQLLQKKVATAMRELYSAEIDSDTVQIGETRPEFDGDMTVMVFPLTKYSRQSPEQTAQNLGNYLQTHLADIDRFNVIKGFLNVSLKDQYWLQTFAQVAANEHYGQLPPKDQTIVVEYCSPNTNKPLHLGHLRNIFLGWSTSAILQMAGYKVHKVLINNDRGIHICKSMAAWKHAFNGLTPQAAGLKPDFLVGNCYVMYAKIHAEQKQALVAAGMSDEVAEQQTPIFLEVQEMLRQWEAGNSEVRALWKMMNDWVYEGHNVTYKTLGADFEKRYYESDTYLGGKAIVEQGLQKGVFYRKENGAVAVDLTADGLDEKILQRGDGTSIYITQDLAAADIRYNDYNMDKSLYVVANEQDYHFKVLKIIMQKLGYPFAKDIYHLSYGMVDLPTGRMKSREGTVVDADDLVAETVSEAAALIQEKGKTEGLSAEQCQNLARQIGIAGLKYFIIKVNPQKRMIFNPGEAIDLLGNTGPFIQYTNARTCALLRDFGQTLPLQFDLKKLANSERELVISICKYPLIISDAAAKYDPSLVANYAYEIAKLFNKFYSECLILKESNVEVRNFRISLSGVTGRILQSAMGLLGIEMPNKM